jgi:hypothetical protein
MHTVAKAVRRRVAGLIGAFAATTPDVAVADPGVRCVVIEPFDSDPVGIDLVEVDPVEVDPVEVDPVEVDPVEIDIVVPWLGATL